MDKGKERISDELVAGVGSEVMPIVGGLLGKRVWRALCAEWATNRSKALAAAVASSGMPRHDLEEWIDQGGRAVPLYLRLLVAAALNGHDETVRVMGAVFGKAARAEMEGDGDALEEAELALAAMADLGLRHFEALRAVIEMDSRSTTAKTSATPRRVAEEAGLREEVTEQCLVNLAGAGLVRMSAGLGGLHFPATSLGHAVAKAAHAVGVPGDTAPA